MESKTKLFGHPVHPIVVAFPIALNTVAVLADVAYLITHDSTFAQMAFWLILLGVLAGLVAIVIGWRDWLAIPGNTRAKTIGLWHGLSADVFTLLFALSWWFRMASPAAPSSIALIFSFIGLLVVPMVGWLGGELVFKHLIGVDRNAANPTNSSLDTPQPLNVRVGERAIKS